MAEPLQVVLDDHELWLDTHGRQGRQADLRGRDLGGADLTGADLRDALLAGANLAAATLDDARLDNADLRCVDATNATFVGAQMFEVNLTDAELLGATLTSLELGLGHAFLNGVNLARAKLAGADLSRAELRGARLFDTDVAGANMTAVDVLEAIWQAEGVPQPATIASMQNLGTLRLDPDRPNGAGMGQLMKALRDLGQEGLAAEILAARERSLTAIYWQQSAAGDLRAGATAAFRMVVWEWLVGYGAAPFRALLIAAGWSLLFVPLYVWRGFLPAVRQRAAIYRTRVKGSLVPRGSGYARLDEDEPPERLTLPTWSQRVKWGSAFAALTAVRLGAGKFSVPEALVKLLHWPRIEAAGWLARVAGLQASVSALLLFLFTIALVGRPLG